MHHESTLPKRLRDLLPGATYLPTGSDPAFALVRSEATAIQPGDLYVHLDEFDSSDAEIAAARGAAAVIAERLLPDVSVPQVVVEDISLTHNTLVSATDPLSPQLGLTTVLVGGSSGSERAATLLAAIHAHIGEGVGLLTTRCEDDGEECRPRRRASSTGAGPWLNRCSLGGVTKAIAQAIPGAKPLSAPSVVCLTSMRCDGLDNAGEPRWASPTDHQLAILRSIGRLAPNTKLVTNADDPDCLNAAIVLGGQLTTFGESESSDVRISPLESHTGGQTFLVISGADSACVALPTPGRAARRDASAAIASSIALGLDLQSAVTGADLSPILPGHLEPVTVGQPFAVFVDTARRPIDLADALEGIACSGRRMVALQLSADPNVAQRQLTTAGRMADRVFAYGEAISEIETPANVTLVEDRVAAMAVTLGLADEGDAVLIAGGDKSQADRESAAKLLRRRLACEDQRAAA